MIFNLSSFFKGVSPAIAGFLLFACTSSSSQVSQQIVLRVNDHQINAATFSQKLARHLKSFDALAVKDPRNLEKSKEEILRQLTIEALLIDFAKASQIVVRDDEVDAEVNQLRAGFPDDVAFRNSLAAESLSLSEWKDQMRITLIQRKVFEKLRQGLPAPTEAEIKSYYEENKEKFRRKDRVFLRQILVEDLTKANDLKEALKKQSLADLAQRFSIAPEGKQGGLVGWVEKGSLEVFDKVFNLPAGQTSQILESPYGFHIIKVERKAPAGFATLEEVRPLVESVLKGQKEQAEFSAWLDRQIRTSRISKNLNLIRSLSVETRRD